MSSSSAVDPRQLPVPSKPDSGSPDIVHHQKEWTSGSRGGGKVPKTFEWPTNPKQQQEENGSGALEK